MNIADARIVIIGGGIAGATTAYHLAKRGARHISILERERTCGYHASGRNAAMIRQVTSSLPVTGMAREGALFFVHPPADWEAPLAFRQTGSLLLASGRAMAELDRFVSVAGTFGIPVELWSREQAVDRVPVLQDAVLDGALWSPTDGVIDVHALLEGYLHGMRSAGGQVRTEVTATGFQFRDGRIAEVEIGDGAIAADIVINAGGAWASEVGRMAGALSLPLRPCRRHLLSTGPAEGVDPEWPFVWDVAHEFYFRPESGGLLFSPCDEEEFAPSDAPADPAYQVVLAEKLHLFAPRLLEFRIQTAWAGLRTLTPDGRFVIGWDPLIENFFWVAGLGGHGVTTSPAYGKLAAQIIAGDYPAGADGFAPGRFATHLPRS
jgi:D-arginine dehydrogenase